MVGPSTGDPWDRITRPAARVVSVGAMEPAAEEAEPAPDR